MNFRGNSPKSHYIGRYRENAPPMAKKILIVEDNDLNLKLFRDLLGANGYLTFETKEGIEAISLTRNVMPD